MHLIYLTLPLLVVTVMAVTVGSGGVWGLIVVGGYLTAVLLIMGLIAHCDEMDKHEDEMGT